MPVATSFAVIDVTKQKLWLADTGQKRSSKLATAHALTSFSLTQLLSFSSETASTKASSVGVGVLLTARM